MEAVDGGVLREGARRGNRDQTQEQMITIDLTEFSRASAKRPLGDPQVQSTLKQRQTLLRIIQIFLHARVWVLLCKRLWHILILMAAKSIKFTLVTVWVDGETESLGRGSNRRGIKMIEGRKYSGLLKLGDE